MTDSKPWMESEISLIGGEVLQEPAKRPAILFPLSVDFWLTQVQVPALHDPLLESQAVAGTMPFVQQHRPLFAERPLMQLVDGTQLAA
jgi:hypothetical protein